MTWRSVDRAGLLDASGNDPYVELTCGDVAVGVVGEHGWACLHRWRPTGHWGGAAVVHDDAPDDAETSALAALLEAGPEVPLEWFSTADGRNLQLPGQLRCSGSGRWDFLSTRTAPPAVALPEGFALVELDDTADADALEQFGRRHNPDFEGFPGRGFSLLWLGPARRRRDGPAPARGGRGHRGDRSHQPRLAPPRGPPRRHPAGAHGRVGPGRLTGPTSVRSR